MQSCLSKNFLISPLDDPGWHILPILSNWVNALFLSLLLESREYLRMPDQLLEHVLVKK